MSCAALAGAALLVAVACGPSAEEIEAAGVLHAADALRDAPAAPVAAREALLAELERRPATFPAAAAAKEACVRAYRPLLEVSALHARVKAALGDLSRLNPADLSALSSAEARLKESQAAMPACDTALSELRRKVRGGGAR